MADTRELKLATDRATEADYGVAKLGADGSTTAGLVVQASDSRMSDSRDPTTHTHPHTDVTDWNEGVDDRVAALLVAGSGITATYDDTANTLTITSTVPNESIDDRVAALLTAGSNITLTYDDTANTLTIASTSSVTSEQIDDRVAALLIAGTAVTLTYDDGAGTLTVDVNLGTGASDAAAGNHTHTGLTPAAHASTHISTGTDAIAGAVASGASGLLTGADKAKIDGLTLGSTVQAWDADLDALAGVTTASDKVPYFTGSHTASVTDLSSFGRSLIDDANAAAARSTLGLVLGTDVQVQDDDLNAIAALAPTNDDVIQRKAGAWTNRTMAQIKTDLVLVKGDVGLGNVDNTSDATKNAASVTLTNKTLTTPTVGDFTNATHSHTNSAGGGTLGAAAIASGVLAIGRLATGTPDGTKFVRDDGTLAVPAGTGATTLDSLTDVTNSSPATGQVLRKSNGGDYTNQTDWASLSFVIDGGGTAITTGIKGDLEIPFACTISRVTLLADISGSIVVDIWKDTYANYPPVVGDSITASAKPTISSATKSQDTTLTGWTVTCAAGDTLRFNVDSITSITRCLVSLRVSKL